MMALQVLAERFSCALQVFVSPYVSPDLLMSTLLYVLLGWAEC